MASVLYTAPAIAQTGESLPPPEPVESYWGVIPAGSDTVSIPLADRPKAFWEKAVLAPYRVVTFPIAVVGHGLGAGIGYADEHRVPERIARLLGPRRGPFGFLLDFQFGGLSGFGGGLTAEHARFFGEGNTLRARASTTTNEDHRLGLAARFRREGGGYWEFGAGYRRRPNLRYFGIGPDTREEDESFFHQEASWVGVSRRWPLGGQHAFELNAEYSTVATGASGQGHEPATETVFAADLPPGYGRHTYGAAISGEWSQESRNLVNRPGRGGLRRVRASYFEGTDRGDIRFWTFRGEAQQFFTLWRPQRILAFRSVVSWLEDTGDEPAPVVRLNSNDDPDLLRGYDDFRWRDRGLAILSAEYRWPVWAHERASGPGLDAYLLTDIGQVFGTAAELSLARLTHSYGGGLRIESGRGFVARIEYARSDEATVIRFRTDQVFQFAKRGYIHGREPIPAR